MNKVILDACCGSRMFWFDKEHSAAVYMDCRELETELCDGRKLVIRPDVVGGFPRYAVCGLFFPSGGVRPSAFAVVW